MTLQIELPPEVEARYIAEARSKGVPLEHYLRDRLIESAPVAIPHNETPQPVRPLNLPTMRGNVIGSLHRRDICDERR